MTKPLSQTALQVKGEIKTIACREGSSGIFTGSIEGLYQGYRFGSAEPDEQHYVLPAPNGSIAVTLRQQIVTPLPPRPREHPFRDRHDPITERPAAPPRHEAPGVENGKPIFKRVHYMETRLTIDPDRCDGIFAGAAGELEFVSPNYRMAGHLIVETANGDLCLTFLERGSRETLSADLRVDGERSTGRWAGARGELTFALAVTPPFYGQGPYSGTIWLAGD